MAKAILQKQKQIYIYIYIYGSKLAQSFEWQNNKVTPFFIWRTFDQRLVFKARFETWRESRRSRREGHFSFNGENYFYCEVKESCSFPSLHFCWELLNKISVPVHWLQTVAGRSFSQRTIVPCKNYYLVYSCVTYSRTSFSTLILSL